MKRRKKTKVRVLDKEVEDAIRQLVGEEVLPILKQLDHKKDVSEFKLADKLKMSINSLRNLIYKLDNYNLVSSKRKKDKRKGWYIYYWTLNSNKAKEIVISIKEKKLKKLREDLNKESNNVYFSCQNNDARMDISEAMEHQYKCPECGQLMQQEDASKIIKSFKKNILKLEEEIEDLKKLKK